MIFWWDTFCRLKLFRVLIQPFLTESYLQTAEIRWLRFPGPSCGSLEDVAEDAADLLCEDSLGRGKCERGLAPPTKLIKKDANNEMGGKSKRGSWIDRERFCSCEVNEYCFDFKLALIAGLKIGSKETTRGTKLMNENMTKGFRPPIGCQWVAKSDVGNKQ